MLTSIRLVTVALLAVPAWAQTPNLAKLLAEAEQALKAEEPERATLLLWQTEAALDPEADDAAARTLRRSVDSLLQRADPLYTRRREMRTEAATALVTLARAYVRKKWYRTAAQVLGVASGFDHAIAQELIPYVDKKLAKLAPPTETAAEEAASAASVDPLTKLAPFLVDGPWKKVGDVLRSPHLENGDTPICLSRSLRHEDHRIAVDIKIGNKKGGAALVFGLRTAEDYHFIELFHFADEGAVLSLYEFDAGNGRAARRLVEKQFGLSKAQRAEFVTVEVLVRGEEVVCRAAGRDLIKTTLITPAHGGTGLLVPGNSPNLDPVEFRDLRVEPLPADEPEADPGPAQPFLAAVAEAERRIAAREVEDALLGLRETRRQLDQVESDALRAALTVTIDGLIEEHDPAFRVRGETLVTVAGLHVALAEGYREGARPLCAWQELRAAAAMHEPTAREPLAQLEDEAQAALQKVIGLPPEPDEPVDDTELIAVFAEGRRYWSADEWNFEPGAVTSPQFDDGGVAFALAADGAGPERAARLQFRVLDDQGGGGMVFGARSSHDFWIAMVLHQKNASRLVVSRWYEEKWNEVHTSKIRFSKAATTAFATLSVEILDAKVRVQVSTGDPIDVKVDMPIRGRFGLIATGFDRRLTRVAFRNFRSLDGEK